MALIAGKGHRGKNAEEARDARNPRKRNSDSRAHVCAPENTCEILTEIMDSRRNTMNPKVLETGYDFKKVSEDVVKLAKFSFDTAYNNMVKIQDLQEKILKETVSVTKEIQADATKVMDKIIEDAKKGREDFKKVVEDGFSKVAEIR